MTISAHRSYRQAFFEEPLAVNALGIVRENLLLRDVVRAGDFSSFLMAFSAYKGDIELCHIRLRRARLEDVMRAVAIPAAGCKLCTFFNCLAMQTSPVYFGNVCVARSAIHWFYFLFMRKGFGGKINVAGDAIEITVSRGLEDFIIHEKGYFLSLAIGGQTGISVTRKTVLVCLGPRIDGERPG